MSMEAFCRAEDRVLERYGIDVERRYVQVPAVAGRAHVLVAGEGPPVVLVIGAGPPAALWAPLMRQLEGFTLYVVDLPGMGRTDPVSYSTGTVRATAVGFLGQLLDGLGLERPAIVAQSIGGLWATWFALDQPRHVSALVLVATPALLLGGSAPFALRLISVPVLGSLLMRLRPPSTKQVEQLAAIANEDLSALPELRDLWVALERLPHSGSSLRQLIHANESLRRGARPELALTEEQLAKVTQPVRVIWGEDDPFNTLERGRRAAEAIPNGELHLVPGGHAPWLRFAEQVADLTGPFLREHSVPA